MPRDFLYGKYKLYNTIGNGRVLRIINFTSFSLHLYNGVKALSMFQSRFFLDIFIPSIWRGEGTTLLVDKILGWIWN